MICDYCKWSSEDTISEMFRSPSDYLFSKLFVECFISAAFKNNEANAIGRQPSDPNCSSTALKPLCFPSHTLLMSLYRLKCFYSNNFATPSLIFLNAISHSFVHLNSLFNLIVVLRVMIFQLGLGDKCEVCVLNSNTI